MSTINEAKEIIKKFNIKEQIEYYLSDENLRKDEYFHNLITKSKNGYINLNILLRCNKIKNNGWQKQDIVEGIKLSTEIELDENNEKVRRKDNKPLPALNLLSKKRARPEKKAETKKENEKFILIFQTEKETNSKWKDLYNIFQSINKDDLKVIYTRFKNKVGHFVVIPKNIDNFKFSKKFIYEGIEYNVKLCENEDLINFNTEHGNHYEECLKIHKGIYKNGKMRKQKIKKK